MNNIKLPLVSIVFTSYNHVEYLRQAILSIINQTYANIEIIIVDDCSNDGSQLILKEYESNERIKLIFRDVNSGSYVLASNYGLKYANGEYVVFAQCDDFSESEQIEQLVEGALNNESCGVIFSSSNMVDENGSIFSNDYVGRESRFKSHVNRDPLILGHEMSNFLAFSCVIPNLSAALIKKELLTNLGGLSKAFIVVSDWNLWLDISQVTNFFYIRKPLNNFRQHNTTIRSSVKMQLQIIEIFSMFQNHVKLNSLSKDKVQKFHIGFGAIWFNYFLENKKQWSKIFVEVYKNVYHELRVPMIYLLFGFFKFTYEYCIRLTKKLSKV